MFLYTPLSIPIEDVCGVIFEFHILAHVQYFRSKTEDVFIEYFEL